MAAQHEARDHRVRPDRVRGTLRLYNYADYIGPGVLKAFEKEFDVDISLSTFNDTDEALTKIASGAVSYDIYFPSYDQIGTMVTADLLRPLNHDYIPNIDNLWPEFPNPWYDQDWQYSVPYTVYTTGIGWRTDMVDEDISQRDNPYDVFWDPQYKSNLAVIDDFHTAWPWCCCATASPTSTPARSPTSTQLRESLLDLDSTTQPEGHHHDVQRPARRQYGLAQMWSGDIVNASTTCRRTPRPPYLRYWFPPDGKGMVDNDLMVVPGQRRQPGRGPPLHQLHARRRRTRPELRLHRLPAAAELDQPRTPSSRTATCPTNLETRRRAPGVLRRRATGCWSCRPPRRGQWRDIWQEFKANG